jgi:hypothetical protein
VRGPRGGVGGDAVHVGLLPREAVPQGAAHAAVGAPARAAAAQGAEHGGAVEAQALVPVRDAPLLHDGGAAPLAAAPGGARADEVAVLLEAGQRAGVVVDPEDAADGGGLGGAGRGGLPPGEEDHADDVHAGVEVGELRQGMLHGLVELQQLRPPQHLAAQLAGEHVAAGGERPGRLPARLQQLLR